MILANFNSENWQWGDPNTLAGFTKYSGTVPMFDFLLLTLT